MFTAEYLLNQARTAGLVTFVTEDPESNFTRIRISNDSAHLIVTLDGNDLNDVRLIETSDSNTVFKPRFGHVDRFSGAYHFALLGWTIEHIEYLITEKARRAA